MIRISHDELTRLAFFWAEEHMGSFASCQPKGSKERKEAAYYANRLRRYRIRKWGKTEREIASEGIKPLTVQQLASACEKPTSPCNASPSAPSLKAEF